MPSHRVAAFRRDDDGRTNHVLSRRAFGGAVVVAAGLGLAGATALANPRSGSSTPLRAAPTSGPTTAGTIYADGTDQTQAIRDWFGRPSTGGVKRMIGSFLISQTIFPAAHARVDLSRAAIRLAPRSNTTMMGLIRPDIQVQGGTFDGRSASQTAGGTAIAIVADGCSVTGTVIRDVRISGVYASGASSLAIRRVQVTGSNDTGIFVESAGHPCRSVSITDCVVDRSKLAANSIVEGGIKVHGGAESRIAGVVVSGCRVSLPAAPKDYSCIGVEVWFSPSAQVRSNRTTGGWMGVSVATSPAAAITANRTAAASTYGIELAATADARVTGNTVSGSGRTQTGIGLTSSSSGAFSDRCTISSNTIADCTQNGVFSLGADGVTISGNTITGGTGYLVTMTSAAGGSIAGNLLDGGGGAKKCVMLDTSSGVSVTNNAMSEVRETGVYLYSGQRSYVLRSIVVAGNTMRAVNVGVDSAVNNGAKLGSGIRLTDNSGVSDSSNWAATR